MARAYVVGRVKRPRDVHRHTKMFRELVARVFEDLKLMNPVDDEPKAAETRTVTVRLPYRDD